MLTVYGGRAYEPQVEALRKGVDVVVGTPGRLHRPRPAGRTSTSSQVRTVVLDEADEMLDLGFLPDVETLMSLMPAAPPDDALLGDHARRRSSRWPGAT